MSKEDLEHFVQDISGESRLRVEKELGDGFVRLRSAEAERRQAVHDIRSSEDIVIEMLRNARDAGASTIFLATQREGEYRHFIMLDDGDGIPASMHQLIFEPRVTSKLDSMHLDKWGVHGRGMALYSIAVNAEQAQVVASSPCKGTSLKVSITFDSLKEKADQSSFPQFEVDENKVVHVRGPKNIIRTATEFALDCRKSCTVYLGSITEIAAALYRYGTEHLSTNERLFSSEVTQVPVCCRLALSADSDHFVRLASEIGLTLSARSARRIIDHTINPPAHLADIVSHQLEESGTKQPNHQDASIGSHAFPISGTIHPHTRKIRFSVKDKEAFIEALKPAYRLLAEAYYLQDDVEPLIRITQGELRVSFPLVLSDDDESSEISE